MQKIKHEKYYEIFTDVNIPGRWFLHKPTFEDGINFWDYLKPGTKPLPSQKLKAKIRVKGTPLDFTMADFDMPIINSKTARIFRHEDVQLIPVEILDNVIHEQYFVLIVLNEFDCIDESNSVFEKWMEENSIRPDLAGNYKYFITCIINPTKVDNSEIFRIKRHTQMIVVSERIKKAFEEMDLKGITFTSVVI